MTSFTININNASGGAIWAFTDPIVRNDWIAFLDDAAARFSEAYVADARAALARNDIDAFTVAFRAVEQLMNPAPVIVAAVGSAGGAG